MELQNNAYYQNQRWMWNVKSISIRYNPKCITCIPEMFQPLNLIERIIGKSFIKPRSSLCLTYNHISRDQTERQIIRLLSIRLKTKKFCKRSSIVIPIPLVEVIAVEILTRTKCFTDSPLFAFIEFCFCLRNTIMIATRHQVL